MKTRIALLLSILLGIVSSLLAQTIDWQQRLEAFQATHLAEKTYLHTDKPHYAIGETIWYSAYLVNGQTHLPDADSQVLYVELWDPTQRRVSQQQLYIPEGQAGGEINTNVDWEPGTYSLRAYTQFQRNGKTELFFQRSIELLPLIGPVGLSGEALRTTADLGNTGAATLRPLDIQFMPEGELV